MHFYSLLRELADSWMLLAMTLFFLAAIIWAFRPGTARLHRDVAAIPFRNDDRPAPVHVGADPADKEAVK